MVFQNYSLLCMLTDSLEVKHCCSSVPLTVPEQLFQVILTRNSSCFVAYNCLIKVLPIFFNVGLTIYVFHSFAKTPCCNDKLISLVIAGRILLRMMSFFSIFVGMASSSQDFLDIPFISFFTSSCVRILNLLNPAIE